MTTLLLNLRQVPDDEAEEVRTLLNEQQIPFYETTPSLWGISSGGIWLTNPTDRERAKALMEDYQQQRTRRERGTLRGSPAGWHRTNAGWPLARSARPRAGCADRRHGIDTGDTGALFDAGGILTLVNGPNDCLLTQAEK